MRYFIQLGSVAFGVLVVLSGCGGTGAPGIEQTSSAIIGGTNDTADPAVVLIYGQVQGQQGGFICTGELISPHVVLTAAHCAGGESPQTAAQTTWGIYTGTDFNAVTSPNDPSVLGTQSAFYNTKFDVNNLTGGNDIGVVILKNPITNIQPLAFNRTPLPQGDVGQPVRFVGYGLSDAVNQTGAGVKRQVSANIASTQNSLIGFTDPNHGTCNGDSGGPAFMTVNGKEVIVGVTSYGDNLCNQQGFDTDVSAYTSFIDQYVQKYDPTAAATPSPATNIQSPTQQPPGGTAQPTGSVVGAPDGAACHQDSDCASHTCGLGNNGNLICIAGGNAATGGSSLGGCSATPGRPDGSGLGALFLAWLFALALRRRALVTALPSGCGRDSRQHHQRRVLQNRS